MNRRAPLSFTGQRTNRSESGDADGGGINESDFRCCCGCCHAEQGAVVIGIVGAVGAALLAALFLLAGSLLIAGLFGISLMISLCVVLAQQQRKATLYMPFLVSNAIGIAIYVLCILVAAYHLITAPSARTDYRQDAAHQLSNSYLSNAFGGTKVEINYALFENMARDERAALRKALITSILSYLVGIAFAVWYESVVYRAYVYMKLRKVEWERQGGERLTSVRSAGGSRGGGGGAYPYHYKQGFRSGNGGGGMVPMHGYAPPPGYHPELVQEKGHQLYHAEKGAEHEEEIA